MPCVLHPSRRVPLPGSVTYHANPFRMFSPACFLGFWSQLALLVLSGAPAGAEWVAVEKDYLLPGLQTVYIDPDTILR